MNRIGLTVLGGIGAAVLSSAALGATITPGLYVLSNHPDGNSQPPPYGLKLTELINETAGNDVFTFSFEDNGASMMLDYNDVAGTIHIFGTVYGGRDTGGAWGGGNVGLWNVDFTYHMITAAAGDDDLVALGNGEDAGVGSGTISQAFGANLSFDLAAYGMSDLAFRFGDEDDDNGHRGFPGLSGWGWLNHSGASGHIADSDWLFTATAIPLPPAASIGLLGLLGVAGLGRRRRA